MQLGRVIGQLVVGQLVVDLVGFEMNNGEPAPAELGSEVKPRHAGQLPRLGRGDAPELVELRGASRKRSSGSSSDLGLRFVHTGIRVGRRLRWMSFSSGEAARV